MQCSEGTNDRYSPLQPDESGDEQMKGRSIPLRRAEGGPAQAAWGFGWASPFRPGSLCHVVCSAASMRPTADRLRSTARPQRRVSFTWSQPPHLGRTIRKTGLTRTNKVIY